MPSFEGARLSALPSLSPPTDNRRRNTTPPAPPPWSCCSTTRRGRSADGGHLVAVTGPVAAFTRAAAVDSLAVVARQRRSPSAETFTRRLRSRC
ncbi:hypothetical protein TNCT6_06450 [Streptomyces sp. 6-11-2]|nr:hypothetical protein TNCT6_06450 [Streptomyces sp. 6-11-2]